MPVAVVEEVSPDNPVLVETAVDAGGDLIERGVRVFTYLVREKRRGDTVGVGYAQLARCIHNVATFADIAGRRYLPSDSRHVVELAKQITEEAGGRQEITTSGLSLSVGRDAFVWPEAGSHDRDEAAFAYEPYTKDQWLSFFPDGQRRLLDDATIYRIADGTHENVHGGGG
jgi:hypothetical protein